MNRKYFAVLIILSMIAGCTKEVELDFVPASVNDKPDEETEYYYWAGDEKVFFNAQPEKSFILFRGSDRYSLVDSRNMDYSVFKTSHLSDGCMFRKGLTRSSDTKNISWAIGTNKGFRHKQRGHSLQRPGIQKSERARHIHITPVLRQIERCGGLSRIGTAGR